MTATLSKSTSTKLHATGRREYATFYVDELLLGVDLLEICEINRNQETTPAPQAPAFVNGVINMRGEVITVVDLRKVLRLADRQESAPCFTVTVSWRSERVALLVDRIAEVVSAENGEIDDPPANLAGVGGRFFHGILKLPRDLLIILNTDAALNPDINPN